MLKRELYYQQPKLRLLSHRICSVRRNSTNVLKSCKTFLTLERSLGKQLGQDKDLQATGAFLAEFFPDLPLGTTWEKLFEAYVKFPLQKKAGDELAEKKSYTTANGAKKVVAMPAQLRSLREIESRILELTSSPSFETSGQPADVLLCVSGTHPIRTLPLVSRCLEDSISVLKAVHRLKRKGLIPSQTETWVVANPNCELDASRLERKIEAGAKAVVTQPPFNYRNFERWLHDADRRGLISPPPPIQLSNSESLGSLGNSPPHFPAPKELKERSSPSLPFSNGIPLIVGMPFITSSKNYAFWLDLCRCAGSKECLAELSRIQALEKSFEKAEVAPLKKSVAELGEVQLGLGDSNSTRYQDPNYEVFYDWNLKLAQWVLSLRMASGLHVMPLTRQAKQIALEMVLKGELQQ
mmetsp:Transcript_28064/g.51815  ORF Transcript_28064/g.51815 Transcript_28064/m.51815 type:complete len:410 (-) Transcript_28064:387-1616(-)